MVWFRLWWQLCSFTPSTRQHLVCIPSVLPAWVVWFWFWDRWCLPATVERWSGDGWGWAGLLPGRVTDRQREENLPCGTTVQAPTRQAGGQVVVAVGFGGLGTMLHAMTSGLVWVQPSLIVLVLPFCVFSH